MRVDSYRLAEIAAKLRDQVDELEQQAYELAGGPFTIGSPKQLGEVLFERLGLPADRKGKTGYSTDARVLAKIRDLHPIVDVVERWREQSKLLNTYLEPLPGLVDRRRPPAHHLQPDHRRHRPAQLDPPQPAEHPHPHGARPRDPRRLRRRARLRLLSADYSQVELRILAHLSGEPALNDAFARGEDIHRATAAEVLGKPADGAHLDRAQPRQGRQLRHHLRHQRVRPVRAAGHLAGGGAELHRPLPGPLPARQRVHAPGDRAGQGGRLRDHPVRPPPADAGAARVQLPDPQPGRAAGRQHGHAGQRRRHHQGGHDRLPPAAARGAAASRGWCCRCTTSCCSRRADERAGGRCATLVREEMASAYPLDPPLEVDIGVGPTWLDAK